MPKKSPRKHSGKKAAQATRAEHSPPPLNAKQTAFVEHYLTCWNGAEAARRAGYSAQTARHQASDLLTKPNMQAAIAERLAELKMGADEVLVRLAEHARASIADVLDEQNRVSLTEARKRDRIHLVKKLKQTLNKNAVTGVETLTTEVELHDSQAALAFIGKHHKLFTEKVEHSGGLRPSGPPLVDPANLTDGELETLEVILSKAARGAQDATPSTNKTTRAR